MCQQAFEIQRPGTPEGVNPSLFLKLGKMRELDIDVKQMCVDLKSVKWPQKMNNYSPKFARKLKQLEV